MRAFVADFDSLRAVAALLLDEAGVLLEANAGFRRLVRDSLIVPDGADPVGTRLAAFFLQPTLSAFRDMPADAEDLVYQGMMTVGDHEGTTRTLYGRVWRVGTDLRVLAEHDVEELERANRAYLDLTETAVQRQGDLGRNILQLRRHQAQMVETSLTDPLTGAGNRRRLEQALAEEFSRAQRTGQPLCAIMADLDFFKRVNDRHGHAAGDRVLARFAALVHEQIRPTDALARYGGEEFVLLMPHTTLAEGVATAERIRTALAEEIIAPLPDAITASFGVAQLRDGDDAASLIERADRALYDAKVGGRNRVVAAAPDAGT